jgi:hypothetical protein
MLGWLKADHIQEPRSGVGIQPKVEPQGGTLGEKWGQSARADAAARNAKSVRGRCFWAQHAAPLHRNGFDALCGTSEVRGPGG